MLYDLYTEIMFINTLELFLNLPLHKDVVTDCRCPAQFSLCALQPLQVVS